MVTIQQIDALLPQTQCGKCGYNGCYPYAEAIATGNAEINQCPPGGEYGIQQLADLLDRTPLPLNPANGKEQPKAVAVIDEAVCIGCTKCIQACPVDAIIGAAKLMHSVLVNECTGCELCLAPCPVDCIVMSPPLQPIHNSLGSDPTISKLVQANHARKRYLARQARLAHQESERSAQITTRKMELKKPIVNKESVLEAIARAKAKKTNKPKAPDQ